MWCESHRFVPPPKLNRLRLPSCTGLENSELAVRSKKQGIPGGNERVYETLMPKMVGAIQRKRARRPAEQHSDCAGIRPEADAILQVVIDAATKMHDNVARVSTC